YIYEDQNLKATKRAGNVNSNTRTYLTTFKFNTSYTYDQTYGITFAYNKMTGSRDSAFYPDYGTGRPNSEFYTAELVYVPFGKSNSYLHPWLNLRTSIQYIGYSKFNGTYDSASQNNTFMLNGWLAF
ncbi:MAG: cytochrome C, partial [Gammaproteobacteria bacterium]